MKGIFSYDNKIIFLFFSLLMLPVFATASENKTNLLDKSGPFIDYMVIHYHYDREKLTKILEHCHYNDEVLTKINHPYEAKPWDIYRNHLITEQRVTDGVEYWKNYKKALEYAEKKYGVPASIIVAVIGIESNYGNGPFNYAALEALGTLAFYHPPREKYFTHELAEFFLLSDEYQLPILSIKSSYAGAIGITQFMPSTYRHYAVSSVQGRPADLVNNHSDAIASIANYLHKNGWKSHQPIVYDLTFQKPLDPKWLSEKAIPKMTTEDLKKLNIQSHPELKPLQKVAIVSLPNENGSKEYWLTFPNFKAIMRYNPRIIYAMAVYQLSQLIEKKYSEIVTQQPLEK